MQTSKKVSDNDENTSPEQSTPLQETGPRERKEKDSTEGTDDSTIVNPQSQNQVTNTGDELPGASEARDESEPTEEERDEELNNARDALNDDNYSLPPDERDDQELN